MKKFAKHVTMMLAGLSFVACSNEELTGQQNVVAVGENATLTLKIQNSGLTRGISAITTDTKITVTDLTLKFIGGDHNGETKDYSVEIISGEPVTLYDVPKGTTGIEVVGNVVDMNTDGDNNSFTSTSVAETVRKNPVNSATVYGITTTLTPDGTVIGNGENGSTSGVTYSNYTAEVTVKPVTARLEIGQITFVPESPSSKFSSLKLRGAFMNHYYANGIFENSSGTGIVTPSIPAAYTVIDESDITPDDVVDAIQTATPLGDFLEDPLSIYDGTNVTKFPVDTEYFGYNFFVSGNAETSESDANSLPKFTLILEPTYNSGDKGLGSTLFAVIKEYKNSKNEVINNFEAGKIYQIQSINLPEDVLTPDPEGNQTIGITATVTVMDWAIENTIATWEGE